MATNPNKDHDLAGTLDTYFNAVGDSPVLDGNFGPQSISTGSPHRQAVLNMTFNGSTGESIQVTITLKGPFEFQSGQKKVTIPVESFPNTHAGNLVIRFKPTRAASEEGSIHVHVDKRDVSIQGVLAQPFNLRGTGTA